MLVDPLVAVRAVHFASTVLLATALACTAASGAAWLWLFAAGLGGNDESGAALLPKVLTETRFGRIWCLRAVLAALMVPLIYRWHRAVPQGRAANSLLVVLALTLLGSLAAAGHAGAALENWAVLHFAADVLHLIAAAAWLGGLLPLTLLLREARIAPNEFSLAIAERSTVRFSNCGIASVATLLVTGVISTWFLAGTVPALVGTPYGRLLLVKIGCFFAMVAVAAVNRRRLTPMLMALGTSERLRAIDRLRRNIGVEIFLGVVVLIVVAALGTIPPGAHVQASWPFSLRLDDAMLAHMTGVQMAAVLATGCGIVLVLAGLVLRGHRWLILLGLVVGLPLLPKLPDLTVEAVPTSYYASPTGYSAQAIAHGRDLFAQHCSGCHGRWGEGVVPAAAEQKMPPDLTGDHVYTHRDGELFWSITHGIENGMPGFGDVLHEDTRWSLVDFIRANADGVRLRSADGDVTAAAFPMPDFAVQCSDGNLQSVRQLRGRPLHIVVGSRSAPPVMQRLSALRRRPDALIVAADPDGGPVKEPEICTAAEDDLVKALAVLRGREIESSDIMELLVDAEGRLRAVWYPGASVDWGKPEVMGEAMRRLDAPVSGRPSAGAHHH
jgi:putative copper export protein/mono/diheme cytochrome c family protein